MAHIRDPDLRPSNGLSPDIVDGAQTSEYETPQKKTPSTIDMHFGCSLERPGIAALNVLHPGNLDKSPQSSTSIPAREP